MDRARSVNFPVLGPYHVLWPLNPVSQADDWYAKVEQNAPWWREHPCWIWQIDAELFQNFSPYRQPTVAEINACGDRIVKRTGCKPSQVVVYAPEWLYDGGLGGLKYRNLWASNYVSGSGGFKQLYPGDTSTRWHAYSGITPIILQYTSTATIAGQSPADANGIIVATDADLQALFLQGDPMTSPKDWTQADWDKYWAQWEAHIFKNPDATLPDGSVNPNQTPFGAAFGRMRDRVYALYTNTDAPGNTANALKAMISNDANKADTDALAAQLRELSDAQVIALDQILRAIAGLHLGGPVKYTMTSTGELTPEAPTS
jgi:hypothetical protein